MVKLPSRSKFASLKGRLLPKHYPAGAARWHFSEAAATLLYTQSLLYRVTGTSEADLTSWPRTR